jgi:fumarate hydratase subunit alpha
MPGPLRELSVQHIADTVAALCQEANFELSPDMTQALSTAVQLEESPVGQVILLQIQENAAIAAAERIPMCQDTGTAVIFLEVGQDVRLVGGDLSEAVNAGVRQGFADGYLRASIIGDPVFRRKNTGDNTPAILHTAIVPGDRVRIIYDSKGGGAENMSRLRMLAPADGLEGLRRFVVETIAEAGPNACPPLIIGVGVGGNFERCAYLAKWALMRKVGSAHADPQWAALEQDLLTEINKLGVGPQGLGGRVTALAVHIETYPCHIAALPVAVNIECHSHRHREAIL